MSPTDFFVQSITVVLVLFTVFVAQSIIQANKATELRVPKTSYLIKTTLPRNFSKQKDCEMESKSANSPIRPK